MVPHRPEAQLATPYYKEALGLLKFPEATQDSGNVSEHRHCSRSGNKPVECGFGGLMRVEAGTLGRRGVSGTPATGQCSQWDHSTVLCAWTQSRERSGKISSRKRVRKVGGSARDPAAGAASAAARLPASKSGHPGGRLLGPQMLWDLGKFLRNETVHRLPGTNPRTR